MSIVKSLLTRSSLGLERPIYKDKLEAGIQFTPQIGHLLFEKGAGATKPVKAQDSHVVRTIQQLNFQFIRQITWKLSFSLPPEEDLSIWPSLK